MGRLIFYLILLLPFSLSAQDFITPNYKSKTEYINNKEKVIEACDWLVTYPLNDTKRKDVNTYVLTWAEGSPLVSIKLQEYVLKLTNANPDFLLIFICGWIKGSVEDKMTETLALNIKSVNTILEYYQSGNPCFKDPDIERLIKLKKKGKLEGWLKKQL